MKVYVLMVNGNITGVFRDMIKAYEMLKEIGEIYEKNKDECIVNVKKHEVI